MCTYVASLAGVECARQARGRCRRGARTVGLRARARSIYPEVAQYIYREIFLNSAIGIVFGYPAGAALTFLLYYAIGFGNIADISRFMWLFPPVIIMIFTGLVCLFLYRKIVTVDMNDSLKAVE